MFLDFKSPFIHDLLYIDTFLGVGHGDDLAYIFPMAQFGLPKSVVTPTQLKTRQNFLQLLHSFATSGKPTLEDEQVPNENFPASDI